MTSPAPAPSPFLDAALAYAARGWHVFPLAERSKQPKISKDDGGNGLQDATIDVEVITAWWSQWPNANIGIRTGAESGFVVVDVDGKKDGESTLELLEEVHGSLPETVRAITGGDGWHHLFAHPGARVKNSASQLGPGVDTRGDGGYIVAPPSVHDVTGVAYTWADDETTLAPLPSWILEELNAKPPAPAPATTGITIAAAGTTPYAAKVLEERVRELAGTSSGGRNHALNEAAFRMGQLVAGGQVPEAEVRDALWSACERNGLAAEEATASRRTIDSGLTAGAGDPQYPDPTRARTAPALTVVRDASDDASPEAPRGATTQILVDGFRATEVGNANRFVRAAGGRARYVHAWGRWIVYDECGVWRIDHGDALVTELAKQVAQQMFATALEHAGDTRDALLKWAKQSEKATAIGSMIRLARGIPSVLVDHQDLDDNPWLLNVLNGTVDLRTGELRAHDPDDLITLQAPAHFEPEAVAPLWAACLLRWQPEQEMRTYLQRVIGTGATGHPVEHLFINLGPGGNGKGKFYGAVAHVLGDYVVIPHKSLLTVTKHEQHDTVKARLFRARLAIASETDTNDRIDEAKVKDITGGDLLEARRMREDPWKFRPSHTMVMHTNHRPRVRGTDEGVWRRLRLIPWSVSIPKAEQDDQLATKLVVESAGILNWIVEGARAWHHDGLREPAPVADATASYRADEDSLAAFLEEYCELHISYREGAPALWDAYEEWCGTSGNDPVTKRAFATMLTERGYTASKDRRYRTGLRLTNSERNVDPEPPECPTCGRTVTSPGHEGWYCDHCKAVFPGNARNARNVQMTLTRTRAEEVTGISAHSAHTESDRTEREPGWTEKL